MTIMALRGAATIGGFLQANPAQPSGCPDQVDMASRSGRPWDNDNGSRRPHGKQPQPTGTPPIVTRHQIRAGLASRDGARSAFAAHRSRLARLSGNWTILALLVACLVVTPSPSSAVFARPIPFAVSPAPLVRVEVDISAARAAERAREEKLLEQRLDEKRIEQKAIEKKLEERRLEIRLQERRLDEKRQEARNEQKRVDALNEAKRIEQKLAERKAEEAHLQRILEQRRIEERALQRKREEEYSYNKRHESWINQR